MWQQQTILAVVPARGGSKGIPRKNLREVGGVSLVGRAADLIKTLTWLDDAVLSTDDDDIAAEAQHHGLAVPFRRPAALADDQASSLGMWQHAWGEAEAWSRKHYDISILLEPTSPLRRVSDIERTLEALITAQAAAAVTVSATPAHFTPEKTLRIDTAIAPGGALSPYLENDTARRQDIPPYYHRNGICYAVTRKALLNDGRILGPNTVPVIIDRPVVNIDEELEIEIAELLLKRDPANT